MKKVELKHIAPTLNRLKGQGTGFEIPEGYFESFDIDTLNKTSEISSINQDSAEFKMPEGYFNAVEDIVLARLKAESMDVGNSMTPDKGYFDSVEDEVIARLAKNKAAFKRVIPLKKILPAIAVAASLLLLFNVFPNSEVSFDTLKTEDIDAWIASEANLDTENLLAIFDDIELDNDLFISEVSNDEMIEFLNDEELNEEWLYEN